MFRVGFDVDDTLIDTRSRLRPFAREVFADLSSAGIELFVWSGVGLRWEIVHVHNLSAFIVGCYRKPISRHRERLLQHGVPFVPDFVVDDDPEVVAAFGGFVVPPPDFSFEGDAHLLRAKSAALRAYTDHCQRRGRNDD